MSPAAVPFSLPDISIRQLEYLIAVADAPTWKVAADRVGVSASALSQGLAELERRIGVQLFEAHGRRRVLRTTCRPVLDHARLVVTSTSDLVDWARRLRTAATGRVRLGMIDVAAVTHFPDVLRAFRAEQNDVDLTLSVAPSRALLSDLKSGALDLAVCVEPTTPIHGITTISLLSEQLLVYGPPGVTLGPPATWGPWVLFPAGSHTRHAVTTSLAARGAPLDVVAESHQPDVLREMVLLGLGWTVLPRSQGELGNLELTVGEQITKRRLVLARRRDAITDPAVDELGDRLLHRRN
ncbi:MAG: LysR family transcriptional regulator [Ilumatobacter sp.]|nr:LysR family transcriptional regulator [Ilumatobacter sp.]MDG2039039.1 LysR family transcriptional regulator [Ilumatobacter sp.]NKB39860.1 LysR family transcriptional regulator [Ilumatobacter sp.]